MALANAFDICPRYWWNKFILLKRKWLENFMIISVKIIICSLNNSWRTFNESDYLPGIYVRSADSDLFTVSILIYMRNNLSIEGHFTRTSILTEISGSWQQVLYIHIQRVYTYLPLKLLLWPCIWSRTAPNSLKSHVLIYSSMTHSCKSGV